MAQQEPSLVSFMYVKRGDLLAHGALVPSLTIGRGIRRLVCSTQRRPLSPEGPLPVTSMPRCLALPSGTILVIGPLAMVAKPFTSRTDSNTSWS